MTININALSWTSTGATTSRTWAQHCSDIVNVKDFGALGDGIANDGPAIQAAFEASYGPLASPNASKFTNRPIYIPRGRYLIGQELAHRPGGGNDAAGAYLFGDGQRNTQLVYTGSNTQSYISGLTSLMTNMNVNYSRIEGIGFDVTSSNAQCCVAISDYPPGTSGGSGVSWIDCLFTGATSYGVLSSNSSLGSEQLFLNCTFTDCDGSTSTTPDHLGNPIGGGLMVASANALDITAIGCRFINNAGGIVCPTGGVEVIKGCYFSNNSAIDIWIKEGNAPAIMGCYSDSQIFCTAGYAWVVGCTHIPTTSGGLFYDGRSTRFSQDHPVLIIESCYAGTNSVLNAADATQALYLRGNTFVNAGYLTDVDPGAQKQIM